MTEPAQMNPETIPTEALPLVDGGKNNDSGTISKGINKSPQETTLVIDAGNIANEVFVAAKKNKARAQLTEQIDSRQGHLPKKPMEQLHIVPFNNKKCHVESNLDNEDEEGESDNDPTHDYQLLEENQLLITGFDRCVESKMASLMSASEASSSADASSTFIGCWNIWGLNNPKKHRFISEWVHNSKLGIIGLLETKVAPSNLDTVIAGLNLHSWSFISNANASPTCRILVGWDTKIVKISCLHYTDQWITCEVTSLASKEISRFTFVYGHNTPAGRGLIWEYIVQHAPLFSSSPWALMGDFNATIQPSDRSGGNLHWQGHHEDFGRCIHEAELIQIPYSGLKFSWHNGQTGRDTIMRKLDWIFCNPAFLDTWPATHSKFLPRDASDHSAMILDFSHHRPQGLAPFKFLNLWADREDFLDIVQEVWQPPISGNPMVAEAKASWNSAQVALDESPGSIELMSAERNHARIYSQLCKEEEAFYKQRSRIQWLSLGDKNTKFFHRSLVHRQSRNRVHGLTDEAGNQVTANKEMGQVAVAYYQNLLVAPPHTSQEEVSKLYTSKIPSSSVPCLIQQITSDEIKRDTSLWLDYWLPDGRRICDLLPFRVISSTGLPWNAKVADIISAGHTPRHAFIFWIASMERLYTRDRLLSFGVTTASSCILCGLQAETHDHLFFQCPYSSTVWRELSAKTLYSWPTTTWQRLLQWAASSFRKPKEFTHILSRMVLSTTVYYIWYERNNRFFNNAYRSSHELMTEAYEIADGKGSANGRERVGSADMERVEVGSNVSCMVQLTALEFLPAWSCSREAPAKSSLLQHRGFKFCILLFKG
ncbi:hypothetical protein NC651_006728 [Populus alba x Populus x berolinensis]|nr:hypothetical protein NC651_006728 [Populus alba x Populus x berolinensis]